MSALTVTREGETKKPSKRFSSDGITVCARTIGTKIHFKMPVVNVSETGMLLAWAENQRVPFAVNTILELDVSAAEPLNVNKLHCLVKVIHTAKLPDGRTRFGVKIIQTEDEELNAWTKMIHSVEQKVLGAS